MLITHVQHSDLTAREPQLQRYLSENEVDFSQLITEAKLQLALDLKNRGYKLKNLCTPLSLVAGVKSDLDKIERTRLVINSSSVTGTVTGTLKGGDSASENPATLISDDIVIHEPGIFTIQFEKTFDYYLLEFTGTITEESYLVETSFELPHLYLSLNLVFKHLQNLSDDYYSQKALYYMDLYDQALRTLQFSYDLDEDNKVDAGDVSYKRTRFIR
jgi:hypothetical protein